MNPNAMPGPGDLCFDNYREPDDMEELLSEARSALRHAERHYALGEYEKAVNCLRSMRYILEGVE